jgi:RHS repeat-associated protein
VIQQATLSRRIDVYPVVMLAPQARATDTVYYIHTDALGSPAAMTDANRNVVERTQYGPYGEVLNRPEHDGPGYTGHEEDAATGLTNMQQRYDDKVIGRFLSIDPVQPDGTTGASFNRYAYANDNPYRFTDPDGRCADHYKDGSCQVNVESATGKAGIAAGKQLEAVLNKYDKAVNALGDKTNISIKDTNGKTIGSITGKEFKAIWNGTHITVTNNVPNNGGAGGGTGGTWHGDSFSGNSVLSPRAVSDYTNNASLRNESPSVGASTLTFHELGHETHFGQTLTGEYPVESPNWGNKEFENNFWSRERPTSSAGDSMAGAAGAPFDCSIAGGCQ